MHDMETCELLWWKFIVAEICVYVYIDVFECDNAWKWFHECEDVGIDLIEKRKLCMYVCSTLAKNAIGICGDIFKLETYGNDLWNVDIHQTMEWDMYVDKCG